MNRGARTKRKERVVMVVVERSRLGASCLAEVYEQVVPIVVRAPARWTRVAEMPVLERSDERQEAPHE